MIENPTKKFLLLKKDKKVLKVTHEQRPRRAGALSSPYPLHLSMGWPTRGEMPGAVYLLLSSSYEPDTLHTLFYFISTTMC